LRCTEDADCGHALDTKEEDPRFPHQPPPSSVSKSEEEYVSCSTPRCNISTGECYAELLDCDDQDECTRDECFDGKGCHHRPIDGLIFEFGTCINRWCDVDTGEIYEQPMDCDDRNNCTIDLCIHGQCRNVPPKFVDRECEEEKRHKHDDEHHHRGHGDVDDEKEDDDDERESEDPEHPPREFHGEENLPPPPPPHDKDGPDCDEEHFHCHHYDSECKVDECMVFECTCPEKGEYEWHPAPRGTPCNEWDKCGRFECNGHGNCAFKRGAEEVECSDHGENVALGIALAVVIPVVALLIYCCLIFFGGDRRRLHERQQQKSSSGRWED